MTILAVIPIAQEFDAMMEAMAEFGYAAKERSVGRLTAAEFDGGRLIVAQGGLGKTQFGVQTQHLLDNLSGIDAVGVRPAHRARFRMRSIAAMW